MGKPNFAHASHFAYYQWNIIVNRSCPKQWLFVIILVHVITMPNGDIITRRLPVKSAQQRPSYDDVTSRKSRGQSAVPNIFILAQILNLTEMCNTMHDLYIVHVYTTEGFSPWSYIEPNSIFGFEGDLNDLLLDERRTTGCMSNFLHANGLL